MRNALALISALLMPLPALAAPGDLLVETVTAGVRDCGPGWDADMPVIAWGADGVVAWANGGWAFPQWRRFWGPPTCGLDRSPLSMISRPS